MRGLLQSGAATFALAVALAAGVSVPAVAVNVRSLHTCGHVDGTVAVAQLHAGCPMARRVAAVYADSQTSTHGFTCHRHATDVAAGWYATCTASRHRFVQVTPE